MNSFFNLENAIDGFTLIVASWVIRANLQRSKAVKHTFFFLLYRHECFTGNYITRKIHTEPGTSGTRVKISMISLHAGLFGAKAGTRSVTKNGASLESETFEDWIRN